MKRLLISLTAVAGFMATSVSVSANETQVAKPTFQLPAAPECAYPCQDDLALPKFARQLNTIGPEATLKTELSELAFRLRLEDWRKHAEIYRRSAERELRLAEDWREAKLTHILKIAYYEELLSSYRLAFKIAKSGNIEYEANL